MGIESWEVYFYFLTWIHSNPDGNLSRNASNWSQVPKGFETIHWTETQEKKGVFPLFNSDSDPTWNLKQFPYETLELEIRRN